MSGEGRTAVAGWSQAVDDRLAQVAAEGRWRRPAPLRRPGPDGTPGRRGRDGRLLRLQRLPGLSAHPAVVAAAHEALDRWGAGAGASRLVTGSRPVHRELEEALAAWKGYRGRRHLPHRVRRQPRAPSRSSGAWAAGSSPTSSTTPRSSTAAGWPGPRSSVYRHADPDHLEAPPGRGPGPGRGRHRHRLLHGRRRRPRSPGWPTACRRHGALLVLDEAHAVLGPHPGAEVTEDLCVVRVGTLSKTLGSLGGFVAGPRPVVDLLVNLARPYIFTTAPTPADAAAALAALEVVRSARGRGPLRPAGRPRGAGGPGPPEPHHPGGPGQRGAGAGRARRPCWPRGCGCRPSARPPSPRARAGCG